MRRFIFRINKKLYKSLIFWNFEDGHNRLETPVPIPNTEVKLPMLTVLVPDKAPSNQAVFFEFYEKNFAKSVIVQI